MKFKHVSETFEKIEQESSRIEITKLLAELFNAANAKEIGIICNFSLGMLRPPYVGTQFNLAAKSLINVAADLLDMPAKEVTAQTKKLGDLGKLIAEYDVVKPKTLLSVEDVYQALCKIEEVSGEGSHEKKTAMTLALLQNVNPL